MTQLPCRNMSFFTVSQTRSYALSLATPEQHLLPISTRDCVLGFLRAQGARQGHDATAREHCSTAWGRTCAGHDYQPMAAAACVACIAKLADGAEANLSESPASASSLVFVVSLDVERKPFEGTLALCGPPLQSSASSGSSGSSTSFAPPSGTAAAERPVKSLQRHRT